MKRINLSKDAHDLLRRRARSEQVDVNPKTSKPIANYSVRGQD